MPEPRRLLVVIDEMEVGGSQRQVAHLLAGIDRGAWQPELAYFRRTSFLADELRGAGIPVHHVPKRGRFDPVFLWRLGRLLRRGRFDVVHAFSLTAELWTALARLVSGRRPAFVASERNQYTRKPAWYWLLKRYVLGRCDAVIANSAAGAHVTAARTGHPEGRFDVVANGVVMPEPMPHAERRALRATIGAPSGRVAGLFVGRLVDQKNLPCLVRALAILPPARRPWIALAGDGPLREAIAAQAQAAGVANDLCFLGERQDATQLMQALDFLVLPSHHEGLSNALLESMAAGCPVVASAVGGTPELVEREHTGLLFPADDAGALADCLDLFASDSILRAGLASRALARVEERYAVPAMVAATVAVYDRCLANRAAARHGSAAAAPSTPYRGQRA